MKHAMTRIAVVALALSSTHLVRAATNKPPTVNPLLKLQGLVTFCERDDRVSLAACGAYISGFVAGSEATRTSAAVKVIADRVINGTVAPTESAMDAAGRKLDDELREFCIRSEWTAGYVGAVVVQYGREHPDQLNDNTSDHMLEILAKSFPCDQRPPNSR